MVEERSLMTDAELDAALAEAFAAGPSPDFVTRVRERLATEDPDGRRPLPIVAATVTLAAAEPHDHSIARDDRAYVQGFSASVREIAARAADSAGNARCTQRGSDSS